jgi:multiple sugar transport system substrate-binding protein
MARKLAKFTLIAALVLLALAACTSAPPVDTVDDAALSEAEARIAELEAQLGDAEAGGEASEEDLADLQAQLDAAEAEAEAARAEAEAAAQAAEAEAELPIPLEEFTSADIDWTSVAEAAGEEGVTLHVAVVKHTFTDSLIPLIPVFEELTGITVLYDMLPQAEYWPKLAVDLSSGAGLIDVYMTGPEYVWVYAPPGWIEPLDDYINNPELTDTEWYNPGDFYEAAWNANRWDGETLGHGGYGKGPVYAIPVTYEIMSLAYNPQMLADAGIEVDEGWPHTWDDVYEAAAATAKDTDGDGKNDQFGIVSRGHRAWPSMFGGYSNIFYSYGALDFDENMMPAVDSPEGIAATQMWVDIIQAGGPPDITDWQWYQVSQGFAAGNAAMVIDCDWFAAATYEQPDISQVAGELAYAVTPPGPDGEQVQDIWFWSLGMNPASYKKDAAWLFMEWATSEPVMRRATINYNNWNPPRESVWNDPDVVELTSQWSNYREVVEAARPNSKVPHAVNPMVEAALDSWWGNVQDALLGTVTVEEALSKASDEMYNVMDMAGYYDN